jgi:uncharacterized protein (TIGR02186 family)
VRATVRRLAGLCLAGLCIGAAPARAETIVASLSLSRIEIASNFAGADLVVFGVVERDAQTASRQGAYDVVIVVRGPPETVMTRRKERFLGIWVTRATRTFPLAPSFYSLASTRPLAEIADPRILAENGIGLAYADFGQRGALRDDPFREALIRLKTQSGLYEERPGTVSMLTPTFFRARMPLPAAVPDGAYSVEINVFAGGTRIATSEQELSIEKIGFEDAIHNLAFGQPLLYGFGVVALALFTGWLGGVVFRRD